MSIPTTPSTKSAAPASDSLPTAHRGLVYAVIGVTQQKLERRMRPVILSSIRSFRFTDGERSE